MLLRFVVVVSSASVEYRVELVHGLFMVYRVFFVYVSFVFFQSIATIPGK